MRALSSGDASRIWFIAEHEIPTPQPIEPPPPRDLPGLIFYHQIDSHNGVGTFISYWETRGDFEASRRPLEERLGAAKLRRARWVRGLAVQREHFWKRFTLYSVLLHIVAVLGALAALEKHYDWLLEKPMIAIDVEGGAPINLAQGSRLSTSMILINQRATVPAEVSALEAILVGPHGSTLVLADGSYSIRERDQLELPIRTGPLESGRYQLAIRGRGRAGRLRGWQPLLLHRGILVWRKSPWIEVAADHTTPSGGRLRGLLHLGEDAPNGLDCQATLMEEPSLRFGPIQFSGVTNWPDPEPSSEGSVSIQTWITPSLQGFSVTPFSLYFEGQPSRGWSRLPEHVAIECSKRVAVQREQP